MLNKLPPNNIKADNQINFDSILKEVTNLVAPSWPLQNIVAVNPFWHLREDPCKNVFRSLSGVLHENPYLSLSDYLSMYNSGLIDTPSIQESLKNEVELEEELLSVDDLILKTENAKEGIIKFYTFTESLSDHYWNQVVINDFSKFASGYFDVNQALVHLESENGFWSWWSRIQELDNALFLAGLPQMPKKKEVIFSYKNSRDAILHVLKEMGLLTESSISKYLKRLMISVLGWASRFRYLEWEKSSSKWDTTLEDCLCVRLVYDYFVFCKYGENSLEAQSWKNKFDVCNENHTNVPIDIKLSEIWHSALEITYQKALSDKIVWSEKEKDIPQVQVLFCIDVRSEVIRRNIEKIDDSVETRGFAGFFGLPISYKRFNETSSESLFPVFLSPSCEISEHDKSSAFGSGNKIRDHQLILSFLRSLRKGALSSFLYVELFGCIAIERFIRKTVQFFRKGFNKDKVPNKFNCKRTEPSLISAISSEDEDILKYVPQCAQVLRHMGIFDRFSPLVVLCGHGSLTTNNAFASSLDCGACGGHAGDINARVLASLFNNGLVRQKLASDHDIFIPKETIFIAAIHETVTDEIYLLDKEKLPYKYNQIVQSLEVVFERAGSMSRDERYLDRHSNMDPQNKRRSYNWSETRPEWGLAGNASFIIAPRSRTCGSDLSGRSFLHDYVWQKDREFKTLELIMTAPMIVTNWINMQYYSSTVLPNIYGAGNKVLHSIINESRVIEGNGGDLKIGLPLQSVFDGEKFVHEPLRLSVFIEAPMEAIEEVIKNHQTVRELSDNEWLHIFQIDCERKIINKRIPKKSRFEFFSGMNN